MPRTLQSDWHPCHVRSAEHFLAFDNLDTLIWDRAGSVARIQADQSGHDRFACPEPLPGPDYLKSLS
jgi:hypothetical protein